jgi:hypothetical protein
MRLASAPAPLGYAAYAACAAGYALAGVLALASSGCRGSGESQGPTPAPLPAEGGSIHVTTKKTLDRTPDAQSHVIKTVFVIVMENNNWSAICQSKAAPFINSLLPRSSWCSHYYDNPVGVHPSEPNYIWMEAGHHLGLVTDADPGPRNVSSADHLTKLMDAAGVNWKAYLEDIEPGVCPIESHGNYGAKHVPFVFFTDVVGDPPSLTSAQCIRHLVPFDQLAPDLSNGTVAQYNFIVPNICNDMHGGAHCPPTDEITQGDTWLSRTVPMILGSKAYKEGGALFITWDESEGGEHPIGMIVLSPFAKGGGFQSETRFYHSSLLRTVQEVFDLTPLLNDAAKQPDLAELFQTFP